MKGIELSRRFYEACAKPVLERDFSGVLPFLAIGYVGSGSDRLGYDDDVSRDHDFEPGFSIFLPDENIVDRKTEFLLQRAYAKLPKSFEGFSRQILAPVGGGRNGVMRTADFYRDKVGSQTGELTVMQWVHIPESYLAEATDGEVFYDGYGEFTRIRNSLKKMPDDARRKRLAGNLLLMAQSGQYNYSRCLAHGEAEAAQLALNGFIESASNVFFLLRQKYMPFYKWSFRAMRTIDGGEDYAKKLACLMSGDIYSDAAQKEKAQTVEDVSRFVAEDLRAQGVSAADGDDLERHAYAVNDGIKDGELRNENIFVAV